MVRPDSTTPLEDDQHFLVFVGMIGRAAGGIDPTNWVTGAPEPLASISTWKERPSGAASDGRSTSLATASGGSADEPSVGRIRAGSKISDIPPSGQRALASVSGCGPGFSRASDTPGFWWIPASGPTPKACPSRYTMPDPSIT
jgi:hypothetical protein